MRYIPRRSEELAPRRGAPGIVAACQLNAAAKRIVQFDLLSTGALGVLLLLRVVLRLFGANPNNQVAQVPTAFKSVAPVSLTRKPSILGRVVFDINALVANIGWFTLLGRLVMG